jgi:hypothetical protein
MNRTALFTLCLVGALPIAGCGAGAGVVLEDGLSLVGEPCSSRGLEDVVLVVHSVRCGACLVAVPILQEIDQELPDREFRFVEVRTDADVLEELELLPHYTPAIVANCRVSVGLKTKQEYLSLIQR